MKSITLSWDLSLWIRSSRFEPRYSTGWSPNELTIKLWMVTYWSVSAKATWRRSTRDISLMWRVLGFMCAEVKVWKLSDSPLISWRKKLKSCCKIRSNWVTSPNWRTIWENKCWRSSRRDLLAPRKAILTCFKSSRKSCKKVWTTWSERIRQCGKTGTNNKRKRWLKLSRTESTATSMKNSAISWKISNKSSRSTMISLKMGITSRNGSFSTNFQSISID